MKKSKLAYVSLFAACTTLGCQFHARSAEDYSQATKELIKTRKDQIKSCYDEVLKVDPEAGGVVTVNFKVQPKTGELTDIQVDEAGSTAPESLHPCIVDAMNGLALDPPDERTGVASFTYEFSPTG